jgi:molybdopterin converting factor subunit 1
MKKLNIEYFAILRERAGLDRELVETDLVTPAELFAELTRRHGFPEMATVKVAINDEFGDWHAELQDGDSIVFIPPVAGG